MGGSRPAPPMLHPANTISTSNVVRNLGFTNYATGNTVVINDSFSTIRGNSAHNNNNPPQPSTSVKHAKTRLSNQ
jgi:hypothetical protein